MIRDYIPEDLMKDIKPCPFCGGKDLSMTMQEDFEKIQSEDNDHRACVRMSCRQCSLDLYEHTHDIHNYNVRVNMLLIKWNNRKEISDESEEN